MILLVAIICIVVIFALYRFFTYKKEPFEVNIPGLTPDVVNNSIDHSELNQIGEPEVNFSSDKILKDIYDRAVRSFDFTNTEPEINSSERWWVTRSKADKEDDSCPLPPEDVNINPVVAVPGESTCAYGTLEYVKGLTDIRTKNNRKTIIVKFDSKFPEPPRAVGYVISGYNVLDGTTVVDYTIGTSSSGRSKVIIIDLNQPIQREVKNQKFCYQPAPVNCQVIFPENFDGVPCEGKCGTTGRQVQLGRRSIPVGTKLYGGQDCPEVLTRMQTCQMDPCPVNCEQNNAWTDASLCSKECGGGIKTQTRGPPTQAQHRGIECTPEQNSTQRQVQCNTQPCIVPCVLDYNAGLQPLPNAVCKTSSGASCGPGTIDAVYKVLRDPENGGSCDNPIQQIPCNKGLCPRVVECVVDKSVLETVESCDKSCGPGTILQQYKVIQKPMNGGQSCDTVNPIQRNPCNLGPCASANVNCWSKLGKFKLGVINDRPDYLINRPEYRDDGWFFTASQTNWRDISLGQRNEEWAHVILTNIDMNGVNVFQKMRDIAISKNIGAGSLDTTEYLYYPYDYLRNGLWINYMLKHVSLDSSVILRRQGAIRGEPWGGTDRLGFIMGEYRGNNNNRNQEGLVDQISGKEGENANPVGQPIIGGEYELFYQFTDGTCGATSNVTSGLAPRGMTANAVVNSSVSSDVCCTQVTPQAGALLPGAKICLNITADKSTVVVGSWVKIQITCDVNKYEGGLSWTQYVVLLNNQIPQKLSVQSGNGGTTDTTEGRFYAEYSNTDSPFFYIQINNKGNNLVNVELISRSTLMCKVATSINITGV
jgi:hypothetical protein